MDSDKVYNYPSAPPPPPPYNGLIVQQNNSNVDPYLPNQSPYDSQTPDKMKSPLIEHGNRSSFGVTCLECLQCCAAMIECALCCCALAQCFSN